MTIAMRFLAVTSLLVALVAAAPSNELGSLVCQPFPSSYSPTLNYCTGKLQLTTLVCRKSELAPRVRPIFPCSSNTRN